MFFKHYSPKTLKLNVKSPKAGDAFLGFGNHKFLHKPSLNLSKGELKEAAFNLFNFLRKLDKLNKNKISIYPIPKGIGKSSLMKDYKGQNVNESFYKRPSKKC